MNIFGDPWSKFQHGMYFIYISSPRYFSWDSFDGYQMLNVAYTSM